MALVKCPECQSRISEKAERCPLCGFPKAEVGSPNIHEKNILVIEKSSKQFKLRELLAALLTIGGLIIIIASLVSG